MHLNLPSVTSHVTATHASLSQLQSEGKGALDSTLTPFSSSSSFSWPPYSQGTVETRAWSLRLSCWFIQTKKAVGVVWTYNPKQSVGLLGGLPPLALSLSTQIMYIHSRFVSDCRDLFLIATTQG